ncbi:MAG: ThuA domain-containing protein, partial [Planctomycetota bacterium]
MTSRNLLLKLIASGFALLLAITANVATASESSEVLVVVGPSNHRPGTHEVAAGGRLLAHCLRETSLGQSVQVTVTSQWPSDRMLLDRVSTVVFIGDQFPPHQMPESDRIMNDLTRMMNRGCGMACIHYATGLRGDDVDPDGDHPLLDWLGGYFASRCEHHQSIARIFPQATIEPAAKLNHPVLRGWKPFTIRDEPYINNYFGPENRLLEEGTISFATSQLPPEAPTQQVVCWGKERPNGGRGFSIVMPHFYENWQDDDLRTLILNGICWTAKLAIPADGVQVSDLDLNKFDPELAVWPTMPDPQQALEGYFEAEVARLERQNDLRRVSCLAQWEQSVESDREHLADMLGLRPEPARTPLNTKVVGTLERDGVIVERLHYQALPGLYVTANFYRPSEQDQPLPAVLYVCGHSIQRETIDGREISYGNKTGYQRHGAWLARHGYVCLIIDTVQWGEFLGDHHGTYRLGRWDWFSSGYTPA